MTGQATDVAKHYGMKDEDLAFVYAESRESGGIFGLEKRAFKPGVTVVEYAPFWSRWMSKKNFVVPPVDIDYKPSMGDGTGRGTTWDVLADRVEPLANEFDHRDISTIDAHVDAIINITAEGANREGDAWTVIHNGMIAARNDMLEGNTFRQGALYQGLFYLATNFSQREEAAAIAEFLPEHQQLPTNL